MTKTQLAVIKEAIAIAGGQVAVAKAFNISQQAVSLWLKHGVPPKKVRKFVRLINGAVSENELRPDVFLD